MAHALPIHIVHEIERRWRGRLHESPQARPSKKVDRRAGHCPLCCVPVVIRYPTPRNAFSIFDYVCSACGHAWRNEAQ
jgi:hypothetical protein